MLHQLCPAVANMQAYTSANVIHILPCDSHEKYRDKALNMHDIDVQ